MIETVMYGSTIIWSSLTKPSAAHFSAAARSPKNSPVRMPRASPARICRENVMRPQLEEQEGDRRGTTAAAEIPLNHGDSCPHSQQAVIIATSGGVSGRPEFYKRPPRRHLDASDGCARSLRYRRMSALVELSWFRGGSSLAASSETIRWASTFPSSTPHWSNESMFQIDTLGEHAVLVQRDQLPERRRRERGSRSVFDGRLPSNVRCGTSQSGDPSRRTSSAVLPNASASAWANTLASRMSWCCPSG